MNQVRSLQSQETSGQLGNEKERCRSTSHEKTFPIFIAGVAVSRKEVEGCAVLAVSERNCKGKSGNAALVGLLPKGGNWWPFGVCICYLLVVSQCVLPALVDTCHSIKCSPQPQLKLCVYCVCTMLCMCPALKVINTCSSDRACHLHSQERNPTYGNACDLEKFTFAHCPLKPSFEILPQLWGRF